MSAGAVLRELLARGETLVKPGVHDALGAMLVERAGFETVGISGYGYSASMFAKPDVGLVGLTDMVTTAGRVAGAVTIPVIADADTGYGNAIGVMWTVEQFIRSGVAAIHLEDQVSPKRCGHVAGKAVLGIDEAVGKIRAADEVRRRMDPDFVIIARTDARGSAGGSLEEVIARGIAYAEAGADMIFPDALLSEGEVEACGKKIPVPLHYNRSGMSPRLPLSRLRELNVGIASNPDAEIVPMVLAVRSYLEKFRKHDVEFQVSYEREHSDDVLGDLHRLLGMDAIRADEERFLPADELASKYGGSIGWVPGANESGVARARRP